MNQPSPNHDDDDPINSYILPSFEMIENYHKCLNAEVSKFSCTSEENKEESRRLLKKMLEDASKNYSFMKKYTNESQCIMKKLKDVYCSLCDHDWERHVEYHNERYYTCKKCGMER